MALTLVNSRFELANCPGTSRLNNLMPGIVGSVAEEHLRHLLKLPSSGHFVSKTPNTISATLVALKGEVKAGDLRFHRILIIVMPFANVLYCPYESELLHCQTPTFYGASAH